MVLSSGAVLWGQGFRPQTSSPVSTTGSIYLHHVQSVLYPPLLENAGVCVEEGPGMGPRWKGDAWGDPAGHRKVSCPGVSGREAAHLGPLLFLLTFCQECQAALCATIKWQG